MSESNSTLLTTISDDGVCTLTMNRPEKLNSWTRQMEEELETAFQTIEHDIGSYRVIVLRGAGKAFCAGVDLEVVAEEQTYRARELRTVMATRHRLFDWLEQIELPVVAAVHGYCLGGGLELALSCDFRLASDEATFGMPELGFGQIPGSGAASRITALAGPAVAKDLIITARQFDAAEAMRLGLLTRVFESSGFEEGVSAFVDDLASKPPLAVAVAKEVVNTISVLDPHTSRVVERLGQSTLLGTADLAEGLAAYQERRPPEFKGQ
jgi:enoyl-CoA hydratase/carnithine racemase